VELQTNSRQLGRT